MTAPRSFGVARVDGEVPAQDRGRGAERWAHLPGGGRGIKQPKAALRVVVLVRSLIKPVVLFAWVGGALYFVVHAVPSLVTGFTK